MMKPMLISNQIHLIRFFNGKFFSVNTELECHESQWNYYTFSFKRSYDDNLRLERAISVFNNPTEINIGFLTYLELNRRTIDTAKLLRRFNAKTDWNQLSHSFICDFKDWLLLEAKKKDGGSYTVNTFAQHYKLIKSSVMSAIRDGVDGANSKVFGVRIKTEKSDEIYLTEDELLKLEHVELVGKEDTVRKMFLIGAYSGARMSDFKTMSMINIVGDRLKYMDQKTGGKVSVPLHPYVKSILKVGIGDLSISESSESAYVNRLIKSSCEKAGINTDILVSSRISGKIKSVLKPKYALVKSHTARKSFATNLALNGKSMIAIQKYLGHSDPKITSGYVLCDGDDFL